MSNNKFYAGIDAGTTYVKVVILNHGKDITGSSIRRSVTDLGSAVDSAFEDAIAAASLSRHDIGHVTATGFGRKEISFADSVKTEISCHAKGAYHYFPREITIIDIGGQDTKIIKLDENGKRHSFRMNRKCAAGTGAFLEEIANRLEISLDDMNALAARSARDDPLGSFCTVFATTEVLSRIKEGEKVEDMVRSAFESVARRVIEMGTLEGTVVMTGGVAAHNRIIVEILGKYAGNDILTPPEPQLTGAVGAALFARAQYKA